MKALQGWRCNTAADGVLSEALASVRGSSLRVSVDGDAVGLYALSLRSLCLSLGDFAPFHSLDQTGRRATELQGCGSTQNDIALCK